MENTLNLTLLPAPKFDIQNGSYSIPQIVTITTENPNAKIVYKHVEDANFREYFGPFVLSNTSNILSFYKVGDDVSEITVLNVTIEILEKKKGYAFVAGGAEHCKEMHEKVVECAGGRDVAKIAVVPTSSADAYTSAMDRYVRFTKLVNVDVDLNQVPTLKGKKDLSSLNNKSKFWILPIATLDDEHTGPFPIDDLTSPLEDESEFPDIDESTWLQNAFNAEIAAKLRDEGFNIIFFTGGNQLRYIECLFYPDGTESPVLSIIRYLYEYRGAVVLGTSAGGAILTKNAILGGSSFCSIQDGAIFQNVKPTDVNDDYTAYTDPNDARVWVGNGLAIMPEIFVADTHFIERGRFGRLLQACIQLKDRDGKTKIGLGADEDTALVLHPDGKLEAVGATGAIIIDVSQTTTVWVEPGYNEIRNVIFHYLEDGDVIEIDYETGKVLSIKINEKKKLFTPSRDLSDINIESDIFGRTKIRNFIKENLIYKNIENAIAFQLSDNQYDSYDRMITDDVNKTGAMAMDFYRTAETTMYEGTMSYHWWGTGDEDYPRLTKQTEDNRFSFVNLHLDVYSVDVNNYPDLGTASSVIPKSLHLSDGYSEKEWFDMFDDAKNYTLGMLVTPIKPGNAFIQTFFFDYAYFDRDNNGFYSPMKYNPTDEEQDNEDYDIIEIPVYGSVEIFIDDKSVGVTNNNGQLVIPIAEDNKAHKIAARYTKRKTYEASANDILFPIKKGIIVFEASSEE